MKFLKTRENWEKFPTVNDVGEYVPLGNYISLNEIEDDEELKKIIENPIIDKKKYSVYLHEMQHYIDHISTVWGIENIFKIYSAYNSIANFDELKFGHIRILTQSLKRDYFLDYYTEFYNPIKGSFENKWKFELTTGLRFDFNGNIDRNKPIPFIKFSSKNNEKICRVPISTASLLETTATNAEFSFLSKEVNKLDEPYKSNQIKVLNQELEDRLYNPDFIIYSAAVHLASVILKIENPVFGYKIASIFAKLALNIPNKYISNIPLPKVVSSNKEWNERNKKLLENNERGFLFYLLLINYEQNQKLENVNNISINQILSSSNLPNEKDIEAQIQEEVEYHFKTILLDRNNFNRFITDKIFSGKIVRETTGIGQTNESENIESLLRVKPYIITGSTYFEYEDLPIDKVFQKIFKQESLKIEEWFRVFDFCDKKIKEFDKICGL